MVHIAWQHEVQSPDREAAEARFSLSEPHALGPGEFAYVVGDTTPVTLMALIADPAVVATDGIDRRTGTITASAPLTARRGGLVTAPLAARGAKAGGVLLLMLAAALAVISVNLTGPRASRAHEWWKRCRRAPGQVLADAGALGPAWLQRGIPVASPAAAGIFRIVFVSCTVAVAAGPERGAGSRALVAGAGPDDLVVVAADGPRLSAVARAALTDAVAPVLVARPANRGASLGDRPLAIADDDRRTAAEIVRATRAGAATLVVFARAGLRALVVAEHAPCSVLVLRPSADRAP